MAMKRTIATFTGLLGLVACGGQDSPPVVQTSPALSPFADCTALENYIEDTAVQSMRAQLEDNGGGWGWRGGGPEVLAAGDAKNTSPPQSAPTAYTKTNTQEVGVDEADFVKTNGTHIFVLSANKLYVTRSWPATDLGVLASLTLEGYPREMYLDEDRNLLVVLSTVFAPYAHRGANDSIDCLYWGCSSASMATKATVFDVINPAAPSVHDELYFPGWIQNSRRVDGAIRLVLSDSFRWPENMSWWPEYDPSLYEDEDRLMDARRALADQNETLLRGRTLAQWVPSSMRRLADGSLIAVPYRCDEFSRTNASTNLGFTTVATLNLDDLSGRPSQHSIVAQTAEVYASTDALYLTTRHWWWWSQPGQRDWTYVFKFDIRSPDASTYVAAGGFEGHVLNQFSMDEHGGFLRVATTINRVEQDLLGQGWRVDTFNRVSVLGQNGRSLQVVGETRDLAEGERIQSARFVDNRGYLVTFEQIDPLFTLDLSVPNNPRVIGELKIPGFSSYLHPLDANHLLAIGVDLPEPVNGQVDWRQRSMKLSIFDVSDLTNPREKFSARVGTANGWSEAGWDHKAFNYFPERGLLAIPFSDYVPNAADYWGSFVSDLRVFRISTSTGIQPAGSVSMADLYQTYQYREWTWSYSPWIRRSVMADDFVYAISDAGIRVAHQADLATPVATVEFEPVIRIE